MGISNLARRFRSQAVNTGQFRMNGRHPGDQFRELWNEEEPDDNTPHIEQHMDCGSPDRFPGFPDRCQHGGHAGPDVCPEGQCNTRR